MTISDEMIRLWTMIRKAWRTCSPNRANALEKVAVKIPKMKKDGTPSKVLEWHWKCEECGELVTERDVDHKVPVGAIPRSEADLPELVARLFCPQEGLQILCKKCHKVKSAREATERAAKNPKKKKAKDV